MSNVIVLAEQQSGKLVKASLHAVGAARKLVELVGGGYDIAVAGSGIDAVAAELAGYGAATVYQIEDAALESYTAQAYARAFGRAAKAAGARFVVSAATAVGKDVTPRVAARLGAGMASEIVDMVGDAGGVIYKRPMWAGNVIGKVKINTDVQVMSVRPTDFDAVEPDPVGSAVQKMAGEIDAAALGMKFVKLDAVESSRPDLAEADVVVAGGRGLKEGANFKLMEDLADLFGGAIGATRAVVDAGWVPNDWQVGQTGKVVAPNLYFAIGISGAIQHLAGMKGSKTIVAVNKDPDAPIFQVADYGIVADLFEVVPELTSKLAARLK